MQTNPCENAHGNSTNTIPTTNQYHHQTQKNTAVRLINHIFKAIE